MNFKHEIEVPTNFAQKLFVNSICKVFCAKDTRSSSNWRKFSAFLVNFSHLPTDAIFEKKKKPNYLLPCFRAHSVKIQEFYCRPDFTWNQSWLICSLKNCYFNTFRGPEFRIFMNFCTLGRLKMAKNHFRRSEIA